MKNKILIVEDETDVLKFLRIRLENGGYEIAEAENGQEAVEKVKQWHPRLVLLDVQLPKLNGYEVCRLIREDSEVAETKVIFLTADAGSSVSKQTRLLNAQGYFVKPYNTEELFEKIHECLC
jgi:two-component system OmpR family response regulator